MSMPLMPAVPRARKGWRAAGIALTLLVATIGASAKADDQPDPYAVTIKVDATADNAIDARRMARLDGQRRALEKAVEQLAGSPDAKLPQLDDNAITAMVDNFEVANERVSAVRYLADYTFHFHPSLVRRLMKTAGIAPAGAPSAGDASAGTASGTGSGDKSAVILPVFENGATAVLWDDPNPWRDAWAQRPAESGPARLTVPLGGVGDLTVIDAEQAMAGNSDALGAIAAHNGGGEAIVVLATSEHGGDRLEGLAVTVKRYRQGQLVGTQSVTFTANPGESEADLIKRAVDATAAAIQNGANTIVGDSGPSTSLTVTVPITDLGEWIEVRNRLVAVPTVRRVDLLSLSRQKARVAITYSGTPDQLRSRLAEANLDLGGGDPTLRVRPSDAASPR
jgi:hypothetical protein